jgi:hypothetical protein
MSPRRFIWSSDLDGASENSGGMVLVLETL